MTQQNVHKETITCAVARCFKSDLADTVREKITSTGGNVKLRNLPPLPESDMFQLEVEVHGSDEAIKIFKTALKSIWHVKLDFCRMCNSDEEDIQLVKAGLSRNGKDFLKGFEGRHQCYTDITLPFANKFVKPKMRREKVDSPERYGKFDNSKPNMQLKDRKHALPPKLGMGLEGDIIYKADSASSFVNMEDSDVMKREIQIGKITIAVKQGDVAKEQANALLNIIPSSRDLEKGSAISESFVKAGGPELVQMYQDHIQFEEEGFVVTGPGNLMCSIVLHVMLKTCINDTDMVCCVKDTDMEVRKVMRTCFKICNTYKVKHLALPPLGCGRLHGYDHDSVVEAMLDETSKLAFGASGKLRKVTIVVYDQDVCQKFLKKLLSVESQASQSLSQCSPDLDSLEISQEKEDIDQKLSISTYQRPDDNCDGDHHHSGKEDDNGRKRSPRNSAQVSAMTVKIVAKDKQSCSDCVKKLVKEIKENYLFESEPVTKKQELPQTDKEKIKDILSKHKKSVKQKGVKGEAYILKGWKDEVYTAHTDILKVLSETSGTKGHQKAQHKQKSQGFWYDKAFEEPKTPEYWSMGNNAIKDVFLNFMGLLQGKKSRLENVDDETFQEIVKLVQDTWRSDLIGKGNDATGLQHSGIKVSKIKRVENLDLYEAYFKRRQECFKSLSRSEQEKFPYLDKIKGCRDGYIKTSRRGKCLSRDIYHKINEYYFFHGTKVDKIDAICENGLDFRLGSDKGMLVQASMVQKAQRKLTNIQIQNKEEHLE